MEKDQGFRGPHELPHQVQAKALSISSLLAPRSSVDMQAAPRKRKRSLPQGNDDAARPSRKVRQRKDDDDDEVLPSASYSSTALRRKDKGTSLDFGQAQEQALAKAKTGKSWKEGHKEETFSHGPQTDEGRCSSASSSTKRTTAENAPT